MTLHEHTEIHLAGLAVLAVVADFADAGVEHPEGVAFNDSIEVGVAEAAQRGSIGSNQELCSGIGTFDDRRQSHRFLGSDGVAEHLVKAGHQLSSSTNRWMVPPHVSPTENASSSL